MSCVKEALIGLIHNSCLKSGSQRASKMAQQVKAIATKHDKLSSISKTHMVEGGDQLLQAVLDPHI